MARSISAAACFTALMVMGLSVSAEEYTKLDGTVRETESATPVADALVEIVGTPYNTRTDERGFFRIVLEERESYKLMISKDGFQPYETVLEARDLTNLDLRLTPVSIPIIEISEVSKGRFIRGVVRGLDPGDYGQYKVLVYVRTDQWYIHPWATPVEGKGFALIQKDGTWEIESVWRGHPSYEVAAMLVSRSYVPDSPLTGTGFDAIPHAAIVKIPAEGKV